MNAVVERFQLGGLVDDVLGAGDLAAVMQPSPQAELVALGISHGDLGKRAVFGRTHAVHERFGQLRHPLTVAAGVGAFGVDGVGQQADDGVQQLLLAFDQAAGLNGYRQRARQFFDKGPEMRVVLRLVCDVAQHQQAQGLPVAGAQLHAQHTGGLGVIVVFVLVTRLGLGVVDEMHHGQVLGVAGLLLRVLAMAGGTQQAGALRVHQVHRTAGATGGTHQLVQHTQQHPVARAKPRCAPVAPAETARPGNR